VSLTSLQQVRNKLALPRLRGSYGETFVMDFGHKEVWRRIQQVAEMMTYDCSLYLPVNFSIVVSCE